MPYQMMYRVVFPEKRSKKSAMLTFENYLILCMYNPTLQMLYIEREKQEQQSQC